MNRALDVVIASICLLFFAWVMLWQYWLYASGTFGFHDLTLIDDWFSNALVHGRPFWVTDWHRPHLVHFTPSLLVLAPVFAFFDGQFGLIVIFDGLFCLGVFLAVRDQAASLSRLRLPTVWVWALTLGYFAAFVGNRYTARVLSSAHFEPAFVPLSFWLVYRLRRGAGYGTLCTIVALIVGLRQDAGFFLVFLLLGCLAAPRAWGVVPFKKVAVLVVFATAYVVVACAVILPWLGNHDGTRFWKEWGDTWPEVFWTFATSPRRVIAALQDSEFRAFNESFFYLPVLSPLAWLANQLPAVLLYTANASDRRHLEFYNAALLLPGMMLCLGFAQLRAISAVRWLCQSSVAWQQIGLASISGVFSLTAVMSGWQTSIESTNTLDDVIAMTETIRRDPFASPPLADLLRCPKVHSVAADFHNIVYAPLMIDKYLLTGWVEADVVLVPMRINANELSTVPRRTLVRSMRATHSYTVIKAPPDYQVYVKTTSMCGAQTVRHVR